MPARKPTPRPRKRRAAPRDRNGYALDERWIKDAIDRLQRAVDTLPELRIAVTKISEKQDALDGRVGRMSDNLSKFLIGAAIASIGLIGGLITALLT